MKNKELQIEIPESFYPRNKQEWRNWLEENHNIKDSIWLIFYNKKSGKPSVSWSDIVDEALCFGWVDGKRNTIDHEKFKQFICKRKPNSTWSKINKQKVEDLAAAGLMRAAGFEVMNVAKANGSWTLLDEVEELIIPESLETAFASIPGSKDYFMNLSKSAKKILLSWIALAKLPETKNKRILEIAENAGQNMKPKQFR